MTDSNSLLVLTATSGARVGAKTLTVDGAKAKVFAKRFKYRWVRAETLASLAFVLESVEADSYLVYGAPTEAWPEGRVGLRRSVSREGEPATLTAEGRWVSWLVLDVDGWDGTVEEYLEAAGAPAGVGYVRVWSGSYAPGGALYMRLLLRLAREVPLIGLQAWALEMKGVLDRSIYQPQQPVFVASPVCEGVADPVEVAGESRVEVVDGVAWALEVPADWEKWGNDGVSVGEVLVQEDWPESFKGVVRWFEESGRVLDVVGDRLYVQCPWAGEHTKESGATSSALMAPTEVYREGSYRCLHDGCAERHLSDVQELMGREAMAEVRERVMAMSNGGGEGSGLGAEWLGKDVVQGVGDWEERLAYWLEEAVYVMQADRVGLVSSRRLIKPVAFRAALAQEPSRVVEGARGGKKTVSMHDLWLKDSRRQTVMTAEYLPGRVGAVVEHETGGLLGGEKAFNMWHAPVWASMPPASVEALDGELWDALQAHVGWLWGDEWEVAMDWLAWRVQRPGTRPAWALLHIAPHYGMGRGWLVETMEKVLGEQNVSRVELPNIMGRFNAWIENVLVVVDEVFESSAMRDGDRRRIQAQLNAMITEQRVGVERKGQDIVTETVAAGLLLFSNHEDALTLEHGDRRMHVAMCEKAPLDKKHYQWMYELIGGPGWDERIRRVYWELMRWEIGELMRGRAPGSAAKEAMREATRTPLEDTAHEVVDLLVERGVGVVEVGFLQMVLNGLQTTEDGYRRAGASEAVIKRVAKRVVLERSRVKLLERHERKYLRVREGRFVGRYCLYGCVLRGVTTSTFSGDNKADWLSLIQAQHDQCVSALDDIVKKVGNGVG